MWSGETIPHDEALGLKIGKSSCLGEKFSVYHAICCKVGNAHLNFTTSKMNLIWQKKYLPHGRYFLLFLEEISQGGLVYQPDDLCQRGIIPCPGVCILK